jgi:alpha-L-fucosidase
MYLLRCAVVAVCFTNLGSAILAQDSSGTSAAPTGVAPPEPFGPVPTARQLKWHELGMYAFCHFGVDTFTNAEWGSGAEKPEIFNPKEFNAHQIVGAVKAGGLRGIVLTCKHHDGFCLWPTKATPHNISASAYKNGKGDIVREMSEACKQAGIKFGVYVSPWDRNHPEYGRPGYVTVYHQQIKELLTQYGPLFEVWFDGANGGDGYYGGAGGTRKIHAATYYGWDTIWDMVRRYQPAAIVYSDVGPDIRWVGNEAGYAKDPCWTTYTPHVRGFKPAKAGSPLSRFDAWGFVNYEEGEQGHRDGRYWLPAEVDVSIRPGWFWHQEENPKVRSPQNLMDIYLASVGLGQSLNLNIPPNRRGLLDDNDVASLKAFGEHLRQTYAVNLAQGATMKASEVRGDDLANYGPQKLLDSDPWSAWIANDHWTSHAASVELALAGEKTFNLIRLREDVRLGQRVEGVAVDVWDAAARNGAGDWKELAKAESVGACRLWRVPKTTTTKVRLRVTKSPVAPALSDFGLFLEPAFGS